MVHRGCLTPGESPRGTLVYAAAFLRRREIILEAALLLRSKMFRLILIHELFHFVWPRLSNQGRASFSRLLADEWKARARGELGESSSAKKQQLLQRSAATANRRLWRNYVCESFCDTAAWLYSGAAQEEGASRLRNRWRERRKNWFQAVLNQGAWKC